MANQEDGNQEFAQSIDRMISDGRPEQSGGLKPDANVEFAAKIRDARAQPSAAFQAALKQRLLAKLAAMEAEEQKQRQPFVWDRLADLFRQRNWQVAGAALAVVIVATLVVWRTGLFSNPGPVVTSPYPKVAISARAVPSSDSYQAGQLVVMHLEFSNVSTKTLKFGFPPALRIETTDAQTVRSFPVGASSRSLAPGEWATYDLAWDQKDGAGAQVAAGEYLIVVPNVNLGEAGFLSLVNAPTIVISAPP